MKTGLVLEGGAMRGMFTAGVLDVLMENQIKLDCAVGVSAGALFGVNYVSGQAGRAIRYNKRFNGSKSYMGLLPLLLEGNLVSTRYAYEKVPRYLDPFDNDAFMASDIPFYAVVTNIETGEPEYMLVESVFRQMDILRASGSMPFVSRPVPLYGKKYLDGGISDSIPYRWMMEQQNTDKTVVVLTQDVTYRKKPMSPLLARTYERKYPLLAKRMKERYLAYNQTLDEIREKERLGELFVIRPSVPLTVKKTESDPTLLEMVYDLGRQDAMNRLEDLKKYLSE